jgi:hypothetical protein
MYENLHCNPPTALWLEKLTGYVGPWTISIIVHILVIAPVIGISMLAR